MMDKYIFVDFYSIHLIQALIRQGSWSSVGVLVNFSLSWVVKHPRCIHDLTWDLTLTHRGLIRSRVAVFWWSRCALSMVRTSQQHSAAALYTTAIHLIACKQTKLYLSNNSCSNLEHRKGTLYLAYAALLTFQPHCASSFTCLKT